MATVTGNKFNTFFGVFVPSTLAILGAVMYFILPEVLGGVGLWNMLLIIILAHTITVATAFSISNIASNLDVKEGGIYYLVSRSLGRELGSSTGILLYFAQTISIAFYSAAFARAVSGILFRFDIMVPELYLAVVSFVAFGILSFFGAKKILNIQTIILGVVGLSLLSIFLAPHSSDLSTVIANQIPFWVAFAMFFPAVTGLDAGVGMSGDLKDPRKSLMKGTFLAIGFTFLVYIFLALKLSVLADPSQLVANKHIIESVALIPSLVIIGALVATGSSVFSLSMTAPRTLRALTQDKILPSRFRFLSRSFSKDSSEPHVALFFTLIIGGSVLFIGGLELISQILTILFLSAYSWINVSVLLERFSKNPSFRPRFKVPVLVPLYGMLSCYVVMFFFNPLVALGVIVLQFFISILMARQNRSSPMESIWSGILFQFTKKILSKSALSSESEKNYRPTILGFSMSKKHRRSLVHMLDWISSDVSISKLYLLMKGHLNRRLETRDKELDNFKTYVADHNMKLFSGAIVTRDYQSTIRDVIQSESIGELKLNTVMFDLDESIQLKKIIPDIVHLKKNVVVMRDNHGILNAKNNFKTIDVWWNSRNNGNFMLLLAHLISQSPLWKKHYPKIRVFKIAHDKKQYANEYAALKRVLDQSRITNVEMNIVLRHGRKVRSVIAEYSRDSDLVILGIPHFMDNSSKKDIIRNARSYTEPFRASLIVRAYDEIDLSAS
ncbi:MAG: amino acid permease [Nanobdellota archaeon]